jgi:P4 family phage/plasmid primase-like protien
MLWTKQTAHPYDPSATAPFFLAAVLRLVGDADNVHYLQRLLGLAASGNLGERILAILHGPGGEGKTTLIRAIARTLGGYAMIGSEAMLFDRTKTGPDEAVAALDGARLVGLAELPAGRLDPQKIKKLTGGGDVYGEKKYGHGYQFPQTHTFLLDCNVLPSVTEHTRAVWDRIRAIPCPTPITDTERLPRAEIDKLLDTEGPGILAWIIQGATDYHKHTLGEPPITVREATSDYHQAEDVTGQWLAECTTNDPDAYTPTKALHANHAAWCDTNGHKPLSTNTLGKDLAQRGYTKHATKTSRGYLGLRVTGDGSDSPNDKPPYTHARARMQEFPEPAVTSRHPSPGKIASESGQPSEQDDARATRNGSGKPRLADETGVELAEMRDGGAG